MNTSVAFRAGFDATFPDLNTLPNGADRVPGRAVGELVVEGLRKRGFQTTDLTYEEPFFVTRCRSGDRDYPILSYFSDIDDAGPAWVVSCQPTIGFFGKLIGKSEDRELGAVLNAIHDTLKTNGCIGDMRWFTEPPFAPFSQNKYGTSPETPS